MCRRLKTEIGRIVLRELLGGRVIDATRRNVAHNHTVAHTGLSNGHRQHHVAQCCLIPLVFTGLHIRFAREASRVDDHARSVGLYQTIEHPSLVVVKATARNGHVIEALVSKSPLKFFAYVTRGTKYEYHFDAAMTLRTRSSREILEV